MTWTATLDGKTVRLDDLPAEVFERASAGHVGTSWLQLYWQPWRTPGALYDLLCEIAKHLGVAAPVLPATVKESAALVDLLVPLADDEADDLPTQFGDGGIPPEAGDQETTSSSGAPADTDGPPT